jgi:hypothetical protein
MLAQRDSPFAVGMTVDRRGVGEDRTGHFRVSKQIEQARQNRY